jgi:glycosyltransferase involved in cell wall biosynthesis
MTRFSVIVPMRSTEAFADECLWSVRRQTGADIEVIAVDDDSPDECGAIADRHARADDRISVVHLARSHGVGPARNAGIARASGDYVLFLDADDAFFDHRVLADLDAVLAATGDPDVLLFDYEEWRPCGLRRRMGLERVVTFDEARLVAAAEHPAVLRASWVCWNKAYRREFVAAAGLRFPTGYYEDFAWSIPALLAAPRVAVSERVGVRYRKCRAGSTSRGVSPRHFEVFDQFERILAFLAARPEHDSEEVRDVLAANAQTFLRGRSERLSVIPPDLLDEYRRRSDDVVTRINRHT